ncbi:FadR family transcriptional regulator (plasmid) [Paroceanicella profunda]|uniref:FadR family transcriptional regulator n=1 Tax=Paroceanicella profunda TaxID=2579971 RepID=A0A5B8FJ20_9RHOB|nr:FadR/GntR family transcriptional regulator [Paroceanicella profunda]QDL94411.1 FadR family transcriptional regulator [Paroceanicella profunda]
MPLLKSAISGRALRNSHAHVVHEIGLAIVGGDYEVGSLLPNDAELAARFGVSRTVLREAMKTLAAKGMLVPRARIGTRVTERTAWNLFDAELLGWHFEAGVDRAFLSHLCDMRLSFEPSAARLAARRARPAQVARLFLLADRMAEAQSSEAFAMADLEFHMTVLEASANPFMLSVGSLIEAALVSVFRMSSPTRHVAGVAESAQAHRRIAQAIAEGDADAAARAMEGVIVVGWENVQHSDTLSGPAGALPPVLAPARAETGPGAPAPAQPRRG